MIKNFTILLAGVFIGAFVFLAMDHFGLIAKADNDLMVEVDDKRINHLTIVDRIDMCLMVQSGLDGEIYDFCYESNLDQYLRNLDRY